MARFITGWVAVAAAMLALSAPAHADTDDPGPAPGPASTPAAQSAPPSPAAAAPADTAPAAPSGTVAAAPSDPEPTADPEATEDGVPHLSSPQNLPPGTTGVPEQRQGRGLSYLRELWQAYQTQEVSGADALLLLTQRPMDPGAMSSQGLPAGPQAAAPPAAAVPAAAVPADPAPPVDVVPSP